MNLRELELAKKELEELINNQNEYDSFNRITYKQMFKQIEVFVESYLDDRYIKQEIRTMNISLMNGSELAYREKYHELLRIIFQKVDAEIKKLTIPFSVDTQVKGNEGKSSPLNEEYKEKKNKVFIIHGHDGGFKHEVASLIQKQGIEVSILSEVSNKGRTIIEKFTDEINTCKAAVVLYTADDLLSNGNYQARPNVIFEHGYAMAILGKEKVIMLKENGENEIDLHSDIQGVLYNNTSDNGWKYEILKELRDAGFNLDINKI